MTNKIRKISVHIARPIVNKLSERLEARKALVPRDLHRIAQEAIDRLKHELSFHLHNLLENYPASEELKKKKIELQKDIRVRVEEWELGWQPQGSKDENIMPHFRAQITNAVKAMVRRRYHTSTSETLQPKLQETKVQDAKLQDAKLQAITVVAEGSPRVVTVTKRTRRHTPWFLPGRKTFSQSSQLIPPNAAG